MKEDEPGATPDAVLQAQLDHLAKTGRMATNSEVCIVIVDSTDKYTQAAIASSPGPRNRNREQQFETAVDALVTLAAALIEKHTGGEYQLVLKTPRGLELMLGHNATLLSKELRS